MMEDWKLIAVDDLMDLLAVPGVSTEESRIAEHIEKRLLALGVPAGAIFRDRAHEGSEYGGQCGNLIVRFPAVGEHVGPSLVLSTHMDTVALVKGCRARYVPPADALGDDAKIVNDAPGTALGGDDRVGCAALLRVVRLLTGPLRDRPRPAISLVFAVQEELGLIGARELDVSSLGLAGPAIGVNLDGDDVERLTTRVTGTMRFVIEIKGIAAHTGIDPAAGVSAAVIASRAISRLTDEGWHGRIERDEGRGSSNVGVLQGGAGTNVVMDWLTVRAEARSHDPVFRQRIRQAYEAAFAQAAADTKNHRGEVGKVTFKPGPCYESFALPDDSPAVRAVVEAGERCGLHLRTDSSDGGMDANWYCVHGIPTVVLGLGLRQVHTAGEWIDVREYWDACRVLEELVKA